MIKFFSWIKKIKPDKQKATLNPETEMLDAVIPEEVTSDSIPDSENSQKKVTPFAWLTMIPKSIKISIIVLILAIGTCIGTMIWLYSHSDDMLSVSSVEELAAKDVSSLKPFEFQLEGVNYQVPMEFSTMQEHGWEIETGSILGVGEIRPTICKNEAGSFVNLSLMNQTNEPIPIEDCTIVQISMANKNDIKFYAVGGISPESEYTDVEQKLGRYDYLGRSQQGFNYYYYFGDKMAIQVTLNSSNLVSAITLNRR